MQPALCDNCGKRPVAEIAIGSRADGSAWDLALCSVCLSTTKPRARTAAEQERRRASDQMSDQELATGLRKLFNEEASETSGAD
ncbi:MAG TPA: hypothetical protein VJL28_14160 [Gemmatimonadaceae bacterium]|nr:hypothetical protein [Gemmatimonadaceae bacterium]